MKKDLISLLDKGKAVDIQTTKVIIIRHAESIANTQGIYQGQSFDTDLSELGKKQAEALSNALKDFGIARIITSPLKRTLQTAQIIGEELGCRIELSNKIIETNHRVWEGKHKDWVRKNFPDIYRLWQEKSSQTIFPQGEAFEDTIQRTLGFLENTNFERNTLVVTHDNIIRVMISLIKNTDIDKMWEIPLETASLNFFEVKKQANKNMFRVLKLNEVAHLESLRNDIRVHAL